MDINNYTVTGRLGKNPDERDNCTRFSIAVGDFVKGEEKTYWVNCVCFGKTAEYVNKYAKVGSRVAIQGKITIEPYEKNGNKTYSTTLIANTVLVLSGAEKKEEGFVDAADDDLLPWN